MDSLTQTSFDNSLSFARSLDAQDPLRAFRERFFIPQIAGREAVYFTGNSLGLQPRAVAASIQQELDDWASLGVTGHTKARSPWVSYHEQFAAPLAEIVGAKPGEVVAMNQLTVNIHLLLASFFKPTAERFRIICEKKAFPSDQYALESHVQWHGLDAKQVIREIAPREGEDLIREEDILAAIEEEGPRLSLLFFGGVNYYTGQVFDLQRLTAAAREVGALAGFDLAHAAGNIALRLHDWNVDFACWCSYKYLNSGPGSVAGAYIHERHAGNTAQHRLSGWWGTQKESRFRMLPSFDPIPTAEGWQLSNAPVLSMAAHRAAIQLFSEAGMAALLRKSRALTSYLFFLLDGINKDMANPVIRLLTPREAHGCQVSMYMLQQGREIFDALMAAGVVADWREPNVIRIAPVPLYNSFEDVWTFGNIIRSILFPTNTLAL